MFVSDQFWNSFLLSQSLSLVIYETSVFFSCLIFRFYFLDFLKEFLRCRSWLPLYIWIVTLLASVDLLFNGIDAYLSSIFLHFLLILDGILSGALVAFLAMIYRPFCLIGHILFTLSLVILSEYFHWKSLKIFDPCLTECILITTNLLHGLYVLLNGVQTYMHRLVALSGLCMSLLIVLFQDDQRILSMPTPIVIRHVVQSARSFFLYSVVICIRNRTSYWKK